MFARMRLSVFNGSRPKWLRPQAYISRAHRFNIHPVFPPLLTHCISQPTSFSLGYKPPTLHFMDSKSSATEVVTVDVHAAKDLVHSGYRYLDVRTVEEFNEGYPDVKNILNIPYLFITPEGRVPNPEFLEQVQSAYSKEDHLVVGCQRGLRSLEATSLLVNAGFKDVKDVGGGYLEWVQKGLATTKPKEEL